MRSFQWNFMFKRNTFKVNIMPPACLYYHSNIYLNSSALPRYIKIRIFYGDRHVVGSRAHRKAVVLLAKSRCFAGCGYSDRTITAQQFAGTRHHHRSPWQQQQQMLRRALGVCVNVNVVYVFVRRYYMWCVERFVSDSNE